MRVVTWNVNGIRPRLEHIKRLLVEQEIDVLCMQETKIANDIFPHDAFEALGYKAHIHGQKAHHGVAILTRVEVADVSNHVFTGLDDKRHIAVTLPDGLEIHNFYVPAGGDKPDREANPKFEHKLSFYTEMAEWFVDTKKPDQQILCVGDLNVAPFEFDIWNHKKQLRSVGHTPMETEHMENLHKSLDFTDVPRHFVPEPEMLYSWWGYRFPAAFEKNYGWRLDHMLATKPLMPRLSNFVSYKEARSWEKPSDHIPLLIDIK